MLNKKIQFYAKLLANSRINNDVIYHKYLDIILDIKHLKDVVSEYIKENSENN
jgi:hypothetical protein